MASAIKQLMEWCGDSRDLVEARRAHAIVLSSREHRHSRVLANLIVRMYGRCGSLHDARLAFDSIPNPNSFSWTMIVVAYAQNGHTAEAQDLLEQMPQATMVAANSIIAAYAQQGDAPAAKTVFDSMPAHDVISCNSLIAAYAQIGDFEAARSIFDSLPSPSLLSWTSLLKAYAVSGHAEAARSIFDVMPERDIVPWTIMLQAYAQFGHRAEAETLFAAMPERNALAWTCLMHASARTGDLARALRIFIAMPELDLVSWTTLVAANAQAGNANLFQLMSLHGILPNELSFSSLLGACSHKGLLPQAWKCFISMPFDHHTAHNLDHYCCMVDVLGRAGELAMAEELIATMPFLPDSVPSKSLLGACKLHKDPQRGARIACLLRSQVHSSSSLPHLLLASIAKQS